jgi:D-alanine-D-alanine ligase
VASELHFPLIVKHPNSYASIGLTQESRVENTAQLYKQIAKMVATYHGALIEEFIEGREFSVLVAENAAEPASPVAFTPLEYLFPPGETFQHFGLKWIDYRGKSAVPCTDRLLAKRLQQAAGRVFTALQGSSYARMDFRVDTQGEAYLLDVNPNCGLFYPPEAKGTADYILTFDPAGHAGFIKLIFDAARQRAVK